MAAGGGATTVLNATLFGTNALRGGSGILRGRVVDTDGRPLSFGQVALIAYATATTPPSQELIRADRGGAFEFRDLLAGTYRVVASKAGYEAIVSDPPPLALRIQYSGQSVTLGDGEVKDHIDIPLAPLATLSGRVLDDTGEPLEGANVQLLQFRYEAGRRLLLPAGGAARITDDFGRFRLYGLAPGTYIVSASIGGVSSADVPGYVRSDFPSTSNPGAAQFVSMRRSEELRGIEISMVRDAPRGSPGAFSIARARPPWVGAST